VIGRIVTLFSALVLVAGIVAVGVVLASREDEPTVRPAGSGLNLDQADTVLDEPPPPPASKVPSAAKQTAGEFILAAAGREDLPKAWKLTHPSLRDQCGCSYREWLTGNIPVQFFPVGELDLASFYVDELTPKSVVLIVALLPEEGSKLKPASFYIGLKKEGPASQPWLVDYWAPAGGMPVPAAG
jgi:hypothetical protein